MHRAGGRCCPNRLSTRTRRFVLVVVDWTNRLRRLRRSRPSHRPGRDLSWHRHRCQSSIPARSGHTASEGDLVAAPIVVHKHPGSTAE